MNNFKNTKLEEASESNWANFMFLIKSILLICGIGFVYLLFGHSFKDTGTGYDKEALAERTRIRAAQYDRNKEPIVEGIHLKSGMVYDENFRLVHSTCTPCHSAKLITQNRATRSGWKQIISWMQETQGLVDLGDKEPQILDYLAAHYAPKESGRRANLNVEEIEWYILEL